MNIQISEIFGPTIQGEGIYSGVPSIFLRTNTCNLRCCFKGSICDTSYTSHNPEASEYTDTEDVIKELKRIFTENPKVHHLVITGGEPMIQQQALVEVLSRLEEDNIKPVITVETNGTISPLQTFYKYVDLWSVSPKLSTSAYFENTNIPEEQQKHHNKTRINIRSLYDIIMTGKEVQLKFVYSDKYNEDEIKSLLAKIYDFGQGLIEVLKDSKTAVVFNTCFKCMTIMLMPEGQILEQVQKSSKEAVEVCIRNGWIFTDRLHIRIWGDKRKV